MASRGQTHYINNEPISVFNIHKYLSYLARLEIIPWFDITFNNNEMQITTIYIINSKWGKNGLSTITYNIITRKWKSVIDNITYEELKNQYPYLIEKNMVSIKYEQPYIEYILESDDINDILEPSLNPFDKKYINHFLLEELARLRMEYEYEYSYAFDVPYGYKKEMYDSICPRFFFSIDVNIMSNNVEPDELYEFINNYLEFEDKINFELKKKIYENIPNNIPEELWEYIFKKYKYPKLDYDEFSRNMWV